MTAAGAGALLCVAAGLAALVYARPGVSARTAVAGAALLLAGTSLGWTVWPASDTAAAAAFALASGAVVALARVRRPWPRLGGAALLFAAALAVAAGGDVSPGTPRAVESLFSSRDGLLFWNPLLWAGLAALPALARRDPPTARAIGLGLAAAWLVSAFLPAGPSGPWAVRRWTPALAALFPALTLALAGAVRAAARRPARLLAAAGALLVAWNLLFMEQYRRGLVPRDATVSFPAVARNNAALLSTLAGSPLAWPANWLFAWRTGLPAGRFDLVAGKRLPGDASSAREIDVGDAAQDEALLLEGWSVRHPCEDAVCRDLEGRARLLAPLEEAADLTLAVRAAGEGMLAASVNGRALLAQPLGPALATLRFPGRARWGRLNEVSLWVESGGRARVDRLRLEAGTGPS
jgi:hypothetical protein